MGRELDYLYYDDGLVHRVTLKNFHNPDGTTRDYVMEEDTYDVAGRVTQVSRTAASPTCPGRCRRTWRPPATATTPTAGRPPRRPSSDRRTW